MGVPGYGCKFAINIFSSIILFCMDFRTIYRTASFSANYAHLERAKK